MTIQPRRRSRDQILADLADRVAELVDPIQHVEPYAVRVKTWYKPMTHASAHASLLQQLRECVTDRPREENEERAVARPNIQRFDADAQNRIDAINRDVAQWRTELGLEPRGRQIATELLRHVQQMTRLVGNPLPRPIVRIRAIAAAYAVHIAGMVEPDLRAFVGAAPSLSAADLHRLDGDVARWRAWCRIVAGWERPAWQPHSPCPHCEDLPDQHAGLRVRAEISSAVCLSCDATWSPDGVGIEILGEHIRAVRLAVEAVRLAALVEHGPYPADQNRGGRS